MSKPRDRELMKELLKYPATVVFRDHTITVFQTTNENAFWYYSEQTRMLNRDNQDKEWIVRGNKGDVFVLRHDTWGDSIQVIGSNKKNRDVGMAYYTQTYPSLFDAFEELAERVFWLPLIRNQTDAKILAAIKASPRQIKFVRNLTQKKLKLYVREQYEILPHIPKEFWTSAFAHYAINVLGGSSLHYVPDVLRDDKLCMKAVLSWAPAIQHCPQQTEELNLAAAKKDGRSLKYIKKPSFAVKLAAVKNHADAWEYIKDEKERRKLKKAK